MDAETVLSYYLICSGAMLFLAVAGVQLFERSNQSLKRGALGALFFVVLGLCAGILSSPGERDPVSILSEFFGLSFGSASVRIISLLLVLALLAYLAVLLYARDSVVAVRSCCIIGAVFALAILGYLVYHSTNLSRDIAPEATLFGISLVTDACMTGLAVFHLTFWPWENEDAVPRKVLVATRNALVFSSVVHAAFAVSYFAIGGFDRMFSPSSAISPILAWLALLASGIGISLWCRARLDPDRAADSQKEFLKLPLLLLLAATILAMISLQAILASL